ncbi:hypothetical protein BASA50_011150 [Batrachochytrium salamandrivorans]|uniref:PH domain-containing protein n=1 Tax=Batrachochytrium salamandrivorans TaxID=1357716 RepID=A0ABQ8EWE5_9FUNG|nr:hypothetical protein BASA60_001852 [Batrachochytrium salamandrivorans]KAH6587759.1 hypothetical protein BASA50_011150 [Batrachochytrium salamandrivorans]KAH6589045.1 hypothetical protein BASA61_005749 [Batrachochytrium salamandrivorans]KAH9272007.1 hypothetical protein BASA83_005853 [Batrachochytrium salamandrivorans]
MSLLASSRVSGSPSSQSLDTLDAEGVLYKHTTGTIKRWVPRHFQLTKATFSCSHTKSSQISWSIRCEDIQGVRKVTDTELEITTMKGEMHLFRADSEASLTYWVRNIESKIQTQWSMKLNRCLKSSSSSFGDLASLKSSEVSTIPRQLKSNSLAAECRSLSSLHIDKDVKRSTSSLYRKYGNAIDSSSNIQSCSAAISQRYSHSSAAINRMGSRDMMQSASTGSLDIGRSRAQMIAAVGHSSSLPGSRLLSRSRVASTASLTSHIENTALPHQLLLQHIHSNNHVLVSKDSNEHINGTNPSFDSEHTQVTAAAITTRPDTVLNQDLPLVSVAILPNAATRPPIYRPPPINIVCSPESAQDLDLSTVTQTSSVSGLDSDVQTALTSCSQTTIRPPTLPVISDTPLKERAISDIFLELLMQLMKLRTHSTDPSTHEARDIMKKISFSCIEVASRIEAEIVDNLGRGAYDNKSINSDFGLAPPFLAALSRMEMAGKLCLGPSMPGVPDHPNNVDLVANIQKELLHSFHLAIDDVAQSIEHIMAFFDNN